MHEYLKVAAVDLSLPPKRIIGNMDREFVAERQHGLQNLMDVILAHPMLCASEVVKKFLDTVHYSTNPTGIICILFFHCCLTTYETCFYQVTVQAQTSALSSENLFNLFLMEL